MLLAALGLAAAFAVGFHAPRFHEARPAAEMRQETATIHVEPASRPDRDPASSMDHALRFELRPGGVLAATGPIDRGSARRFVERVRALDGQVKTLSLDSPGGSVDDAMAIGRLARSHGIATEVADGAVCASSCPLLFAGGVARAAGETAAIGLHQFHAPARMAAGDAAQAVSDAQMTAARIARYLGEMGVDPALWLHALDTPPQSLYRMSRAEMTKYRLVTAGGV